MKRLPGETKVRGDAVLKNLPDDRQAAIAEYGNAHTIRETMKWLADDGLLASKDQVSQFLCWYALRSISREDEATVDSMKEELKREVQEITDAELDAFGQKTFSLLSIRRQDLDGFVSIRTAKATAEIEKAKLKLRERAEERQSKKLKLETVKWEFNAAQACLDKLPELQVIRKDSSLTTAEKLDQIRLKLFGVLAPEAEVPAQ